MTAQDRMDLAFGRMARLLEEASDATAQMQQVITAQAEKIKALESDVDNPEPGE